MKLCFVLEGYPYGSDYIGSFVRELIVQLADRGVQCSVIAPQSIPRALKHRLKIRPRHWQDVSGQGVPIEVYQPYYMTLSNRSRRLAQGSLVRAVRRGYRRLSEPAELLYAHFWHMGVSAAQAIGELPVMVACGESRISVRDRFDDAAVDQLMARLSGVIYVSSKCLQEASELSLQKNTPYLIAPNGYKPEEFYPRDRAEARKRLKLPEDGVIGVFVGSFDERKGVMRVSRAAGQIKGLKMIYLGAGAQSPQGEGVLVCGRASHGELPDYLSAADFFVLPTRAEGCCNAIVEALACGLPVISSDGIFNDDLLNESNSIRLPADDEEALLAAMQKLTDEPQTRKALSVGALEKAKELELGQRADRILRFMTAQVEHHGESEEGAAPGKP